MVGLENLATLCLRVAAGLVLWIFAASTGAAPAPPSDGSGASELEAGFAWAETSVYRPPDFDGYFADSDEGARQLAAWWAQSASSRSGDPAGLDVVREGLRAYDGDPEPILRWVGNTFIRGKGVSSGAAIELMYHASGSMFPGGERDDVGSAAVYFGLAVVRPKSESILRTLVDVCMASDDPRQLSRITWSLGGQRGEALDLLDTYHHSENEDARDKAMVVRGILNREIRAFDWAEKRTQDWLSRTYEDDLELVSHVLRNGSSEQRSVVLDQIERDNVAEIMDAAYVNAFAMCATDASAENRARVARIVGRRWIATVREQDPAAVDLLAVLSEDVDQDVRYDAAKFGLSYATHKDFETLRNLLDVVIENRDPDLRNRVVAAMRKEKEHAARLLKGYVEDASTATIAREVYEDVFDAPPTVD